MSGFEIGGIVLAAFPLALIGLDRYREVVDTVILWDPKTQVVAIEALSFQLRVQETLFRNSYETLLLLFLDKASVIAILSDPHELNSQRHELITKNLKARLGHQWIVYDGLMKKLQKALQRLTEELDKSLKYVASSDKSKHEASTERSKHELTAERVKAFFGRVKYSLTVKFRTGILEDIKNVNQELALLTSQLRTLKDLSRLEEKPVKDSFQGFGDYQKWIKNFLTSILANVLCPADRACIHKLGLAGFHYFVRENSSFEYVLHDFLIQYQEDAESSPVLFCVNPKSTTEKQIGHPLKDLCSMAETVIAEEWRHGDELLKPPSINDYDLADSPENSPGVPVESLDTVSGWTDSTAGNVNVRLYNSKAYYPAPEMVSLEKIMKTPRRYSCYPGYFFEHDRSRLAAGLANSMLLYGTCGMLPQNWSNSDVLVYQADDDVDSKCLINAFTFFIVPKKQARGRPVNSKSNEDQESRQFGVQNELLYSLGMMLLELLLNSPLESYREHAAESKTHIAWRVEKLAMRHGGPRWAEIIRKCLHCPFEEEPTFSNPVFVEKIYHEILQPLYAFSRLPNMQVYDKTRSTSNNNLGNDAQHGYTGDSSRNSYRRQTETTRPDHVSPLVPRIQSPSR